MKYVIEHPQCTKDEKPAEALSEVGGGGGGGKEKTIYYDSPFFSGSVLAR